MTEYGNLIIYKDKDGNNNIEVKMYDNTIWLSQEQLVSYIIPVNPIFQNIQSIF